MQKRKNISSNGFWEEKIGYSRAVRAGNLVEISGTTSARADGTTEGEGDAYAQAKIIFAKIEKALEEAGCSLDDVIRTRIYLLDFKHWEDAGRAHAEVFGKIKPASTMVEVSALMHPEMLVEIEATAYKSDS